MLEVLYEGKSKIVYKSELDDCYIIKFKDTATAFNGEKKEELEGKGILNAQISNLIFGYLAKNGIKTHFVKVLDKTSILAKKAEIIPIEVIVRNLAAGGFAKKYGIVEGSTLKNTILEFCYKSDELGDPMINQSQITAIGLASEQELEQMKAIALKINKLLSNLFQEVNVQLVDFKLEFGRSNNEIILCDEISPDSCRLWDMSTSEKLDKDRFRRNLGNVLDGYREILRRLENV